jgi:exosome complex component RRP46
VLELQQADSTHVLAFSSQRELLVAESEGAFTVDEWDLIHDAAERICCGAVDTDANAMRDLDDNDTPVSMKDFITSTLQENVATGLYWKE